MENKDYASVGRYYNKYQPEEHLTIGKLNATLFQFYPEFVRAGVFFRIQSVSDENTTDNQYKKFDCQLVWITPERNEKILAIGELEYGADQMKKELREKMSEWNNKFPKNRWYCISLLERKKYDENFHFFLKVSPTRNSAFIIDTRDNFVTKNMTNNYNMENDSTNEKFNTDKGRYEFNWECVDKNTMLFKKEGDLLKVAENGNICLIEDDYWKKLHRFLAHKFFPKELVEEIIYQNKLKHQQYRELGLE